MLRAAASFERALALLFFGDKTWAVAALVREAARVVRVVAAGAFGAAALTLFLGTASSAAFSLSSLDISSLPRFFPRADFVSLVAVGFGAALMTAGFGIDFGSSVGAAGCDEVAVCAVRVLRVGAGTGAFFAGAAFAGVDFAGSDVLRSSTRDI